MHFALCKFYFKIYEQNIKCQTVYGSSILLFTTYFKMHKSEDERIFFLNILFIYLFLGRGKGREKERVKNINVKDQLPLLLTGD